MVDEALKNHFFNAINLARSYKNAYFIFGHLLIEILQLQISELEQFASSAVLILENKVYHLNSAPLWD